VENKMIGTGGTSPFGAYGDHPGRCAYWWAGRKRSAVKVWEQRKYQNLMMIKFSNASDANGIASFA
jgi:uncharacterized protein with von Willebrand factor type A (vWA) domain